MSNKKAKKAKKVTRVPNKIKVRKIVKKILSKKQKSTKVVQNKEPVIVAPVAPVKTRKTRRKKSAGVMYFTQDTEDAIVEFNKTEDLERREVLYNGRIKYPFEKLVENIFNTFKFTYFETGPIEIQRET